MLSLKNSLAVLKKTNALLEGHFVLSSGLHSPKYIQCAKLLSYPYLAKKLCESLAYKIKNQLQGLRLGRVLVENSGNIGKSYRRHDEVGTPLCITLDFQTLEDQTLTVRNRDNMEQERIHQNETAAYLQEIIK